MVRHLSRFARILAVPLVVTLATWQVALALNHERLPHLLGQRVGWSARVLNPIPDDGTIPPLGPIDPEFVDASTNDPTAFSQAMDRFAQTDSRPTGRNALLGSGHQAGLLDQDGVYPCQDTRPLVVVTRAGDDNADDVAQTYFTPSGWDGMR
jgi:hypothetical protein